VTGAAFKVVSSSYWFERAIQTFLKIVF